MIRNERAIRKSGWILLLAGLAMMSIVWLASETKAYGAQQAEVTAYADQERIAFEIKPQLTDGTVVVQLRPLFEALGIELEWDPASETVRGSKGDHAFALPLGSKTATVNGQSVSLSRAAAIIEGYTMVPIRFVGEATGAVVGWNSDTQTIQVFSEEYRSRSGMSEEEAQTLANRPLNTEASASELDGLYARWSMDLLGVRGCATLCWDYYYFAGNKALTELPEEGPDAAACARDDACMTYELQGDRIVFGDGTAESFERGPGGELIIDELPYQKIEAQDGLKLSGTYTAESYIDTHPGVDIALANTYRFREDGTFVDASWAGVVTDGSDPDIGGDGTGGSSTIADRRDSSGTYAIEGYSIRLQYADGTSARYLFFLPDQPDVGIVRIGELDYVIKE